MTAMALQGNTRCRWAGLCPMRGAELALQGQSGALPCPHRPASALGTGLHPHRCADAQDVGHHPHRPAGIWDTRQYPHCPSSAQGEGCCHPASSRTTLHQG